MLLVVTGSRMLTNPRIVHTTLDTIHSDSALNGIEVMFTGDCPTGADKACKAWALVRGIQLVHVPANWNGPHGWRAGLWRNGLMLHLAGAFASVEKLQLRLVAFPTQCTKQRCLGKNDAPHWSHGTHDCWERAGILGIRRKFVIADEATK